MYTHIISYTNLPNFQILSEKKCKSSRFPCISPNTYTGDCNSKHLNSSSSSVSRVMHKVIRSLENLEDWR